MGLRFTGTNGNYIDIEFAGYLGNWGANFWDEIMFIRARDGDYCMVWNCGGYSPGDVLTSSIILTSDYRVPHNYRLHIMPIQYT